MKFGFIAEEKVAFPIAVLCRVLDVSPSGYYTSRARPVSPHARRDAELSEQIAIFHAASKRPCWLLRPSARKWRHHAALR